MLRQWDGSVVRKTIERALQDMPALPDVVTKVLQETEREHATSADLEKLLSSDPALASKTLRVVNSAYYGLAGQVSSLSQAVVILGLQQIRNLVLSISALSMMKARTPRQREIQKHLWTHSLATAAGAQLIAKKKKLDSTATELAFLGGLLHDIGKLFLFTNFTETYGEVVNIAENRKMSVLKAEALLLGITHGEVGKELVKHWHFPQIVCDMVGTHEGPFTHNTPSTVLAVHAADRISDELFEKDPEGQIDPVAAEWLAFTEDELAWLREEVLLRVSATRDFFGLLAA